MAQAHATRPLRPIDTTPIHEKIQLRIKEYILANELRPGDPLPSEAEFTEQLGVSRAVVREALRALESLGFIQSRRGGGRYVGEFNLDPIVQNLSYSMLSDMEDVRDLLEVRERLEMSFITDAISAMDEATLQHLHTLVKKMYRKEAAEQHFMEEDVAFHRAIFSTVGNHLLIKLLDVFWHVHRNLREKSRLLPRPQEMPADAQNHEQILQAIEAKDPELTMRRLARHFDAIRNQIAEASRKRLEADEE